MEIREVRHDKKRYLPLLLLADEQEDMIDRYLERGTMYVLDDGGVKGECVVTDEGGGVLEIKNIATEPTVHGKGYGRALVEFVAARYRGEYAVLQVGTGDSPLTIPFYEKCGYPQSRPRRPETAVRPPASRRRRPLLHRSQSCSSSPISHAWGKRPQASAVLIRCIIPSPRRKVNVRTD